MRQIKVKRIVCVNNEVEKHGAANLLPGDIDEKRNWLCEKGTPKGIAILELECRSVITAIRIGNAYSAFVEILVGNCGDPTDKYETLIPPTQLMSYQDSRLGRNTNQVKFFYQTDFRKDAAHKEWEVIQLVCTQPFNKEVRFGLCFIRVTGLGDDLVIVPERKKEEQTSSVPHIKKIESEDREPKTPEETPKSETCSKIKVASIKIKSPRSGDKRKQKSPRQDYPDNRRNKYIGLEGSHTRKKKMDEEPRPSTSKADDEEKIGRIRVKKEFRMIWNDKKDYRVLTSRRFSRLMENVFFTLSGFKNPERAEIRRKALQMGAKYASDWNSLCSHLICSCVNTPKFSKVRGKGRIVTKEWIEASFKDRRRYPWRRFALDPAEMIYEESEEEISAEEDETPAVTGSEETPGPSSEEPPEKKIKQEEPEPTETEEDKAEDTAILPMPYLPDMLTGKVFYLDENLQDYCLAYRYIIAYNGEVRTELTADVDFYVTETEGEPLKILREKAPKMKAVRPAWIWAMNSASEWVSPWKFMLSA